jgi:hypothetical protein
VADLTSDEPSLSAALSRGIQIVAAAPAVCGLIV